MTARVRLLFVPIVACVAVLGGAGRAEAEGLSSSRGKAVFDLWCAGCHKPVKQGEPGLAGTSSLQRKYGGSVPAALEERTNLTPAYLKLIVRQGVKSMPMTRKTEISDADLDALADYLAKAK